MVLGGGADHRGSADVDLLDGLVGAGTGGDGLGERVEVGDHQVEGRDPELLELLDVGGQSPVGEDAGMHHRMQGLHPAVQAFGEAGDLLDRGDRQAGVGQPLGGGTGGDQLDTGRDQRPAEVFQSGLVIDGDEGAPDRLSALRFGHCCSLVARWLTVSISSRRSATLIRSWRDSSVSPGWTSTGAWARIRPVSTPASTVKTVAPVTFTP